MTWQKKVWSKTTMPDDALDDVFWHAEDGPFVAEVWPRRNGQWRLWVMKRDEWASLKDFATLAAAKEAAIQ